MKKLFLLLLLPAFACCGKYKGYQIEGVVPGAPEGLTVWLLNTDDYPFVAVDSAEIKEGRFIMRNETPLDYPYNATLVIAKAPRRDRPESDAKAYRFFMDNGEIVFQCQYDSLPSYYYEPRSKMHNVSLTGSATQDLNMEYNMLIKKLADENSALWQEYLKVYHRPALDGVFNTEQGKEIVMKRKKVGNEMNDLELDFIDNHNASVVSVNIALNMLKPPTRARFTAGWIDSLMNRFDPSVHDAPLFAKLTEAAANARNVAYGEKYKDIELIDKDGNKVKLSDYIQPGKYNMLEFWASWCGPCRGEIPHLRHLYEQVGMEKLNMISISIDEKTEDWLRAVEEEKMSWIQLCDPKGQTVGREYYVNGIPDCLLIDPEGRIAGGNYRGASLDVAIESLTGATIQ